MFIGLSEPRSIRTGNSSAKDGGAMFFHFEKKLRNMLRNTLRNTLRNILRNILRIKPACSFSDPGGGGHLTGAYTVEGSMPVADGRRGFGAADQAIEVFESVVPALVRAVCEQVCEQWRSL